MRHASIGVVFPLLIMLGGCGASGEGDTTPTTGPQSATTTTAVPATTTSLASPTTVTETSTTTPPAVLPPQTRWLTVDAFAGIEFGAPSAQVTEALEPTLGGPSGRGGPACTGLQQITYPDLALYLDEDRLVGWWYGGGMGLATPSGVQPDITPAASLPGTYGDVGLHVVTDTAGSGTFIYVLTTEDGPAYLAGEITNGVIGSLFAGSTCLGPDPVYLSPADAALGFWNAYFVDYPLSLIATADAIAWIEEYGDRDLLPDSMVAVLDEEVSLQLGGDPSGCWLDGDVTLACVLERPGAFPALEDLVIYVQDRGRPDPVNQTRLGAWLVVGVDYASTALYFD